MAGKVYFVGAGPGNPTLLTCRGRQCLRQADLVLYDYLADPELLEHVSADCELICLGAHGKSRLWRLAEIQTKLVEAAAAGKQVVRLKGGDPSVFGRLGEELAALQRAEADYEIVPGITAAIGAAAYADVGLTHREWSSALALVTGQETADKSQAPLDYRLLAKFPGTLAIYMGVTTAAIWSRELIEGGKPPDTPVVVVRRASWPDQETQSCRLDELAELIDRHHLRPPVIFLVGQAARANGASGWFERLPLFGRTILIARPHHQAHAMRELLREHGAATIVHPVIEIGPPNDDAPLDHALEQLPQFDWIVFSSANGVAAVLDRLWAQGRDTRQLGPARIAAIGPATERALEQYFLRVDRVPSEFRAEALADELAPDVVGKRVLLVRANRGREILAERLRDAGAQVDQVVAYQSVDVETADPEVTKKLADGEIDWITVTSSAIAHSLVRLFGDALQNTQLASISPITSGTLRSLGFEPATEAIEYTIEGVVEAICAAESGKG